MKDKNYLIQNGVDVDKSLELFGDMEMYNESIKDFLTDASSKLDKLRNFKAKGDMANYAIEVHALKSDARYFGFMKLGDMAYDHELKSKENNMFYITEHFDELEQETIKALNITRTYLGEETSDVNLSTNENSAKTSLKTILVVDDSEVIKNFIKKIFNGQYEVLIASDGMEAMNMIAEKVNSGSKFEGVLLDLNMPNVNGFQVLDFFKKNNLFEKIPVSIITGVGSDDLVAKAYEYDIVDVLRKPFNENDIKRVVEKTINR